MENFQDIYLKNKSNLLGYKYSNIDLFKQKLLNKIKIDSKYFNKDESIKHLDKGFLNNFIFKFDKLKNNIIHAENNNIENSILNISDTTLYELTNFKKNKIIFNTLYDNLDLIDKLILKDKKAISSDFILNLNTIFLNSGFEIIIQNNDSQLLTINHEYSDKAIFAKNYFRIGKNVSITIIENINSKNKSYNNLLNFFDLDEGSNVNHYVLHNSNEDSLSKVTSFINCSEKTSFNQCVFNISSSNTRNHHYGNLNGQNSEINLRGIFFGAREQIIDNKTEINHFFPNCSSNQTYKGILGENAKASYLSKTYVKDIAQKTEGYQLSKGIILSDKASFYSKPELKIYADDVKCSHGSTISSFDKNQIFYLRSRGLSKKLSKSFLIKSFYNDIIDSLDNKNYVNDVRVNADNWIKKNLN